MTEFRSVSPTRARHSVRDDAGVQIERSGSATVAQLARRALFGLILALAGCGALPRNPVPAELVFTATMPAAIPDMPEVRAWAGRRDPAMERDLDRSFDQESRADFPIGAGGVVRYPHLALSGGGANGAFGAGFLNGWTATGRRPVFKIVTGVSTGHPQRTVARGAGLVHLPPGLSR